MSKARKRELKALVREGNKLARKFVNIFTCPLGDTDHHERRFETWMRKISQTHPRVWKYYQDGVGRWVEQDLTRYHRPRVKGRDGFLYSESDMDRAMMYGG